MSINSVDSLAYTKYTKNENPYLACNTGKKVGAAVGATAAGVGTALALKNGSLMNMANTTLTKVSTGSGKIAQIVAKYPKFFGWRQPVQSCSEENIVILNFLCYN